VRSPVATVTSPRFEYHSLEGTEIRWGLVRFLRRLDRFRNAGRLATPLGDCTAKDTSRTTGPYLRDYVRHSGGSQKRLGLSASLCKCEITQVVYFWGPGLVVMEDVPAQSTGLGGEKVFPPLQYVPATGWS